jgi:hypothetical protein
MPKIPKTFIDNMKDHIKEENPDAMYDISFFFKEQWKTIAAYGLYAILEAKIHPSRPFTNKERVIPKEINLYQKGYL